MANNAVRVRRPLQPCKHHERRSTNGNGALPFWRERQPAPEYSLGRRTRPSAFVGPSRPFYAPWLWNISPIGCFGVFGLQLQKSRPGWHPRNYESELMLLLENRTSDDI